MTQYEECNRKDNILGVQKNQSNANEFNTQKQSKGKVHTT